MKTAFTMIEVIFVIVIIGILSAIAIPKLAATKSDAEASKIVNALSTCINDAGNEYIFTGSFHHRTQQDENLTVSCRYAIKCFDITESDSNGSLSVASNSSALPECKLSQEIAKKNILASVHDFYF